MKKLKTNSKAFTLLTAVLGVGTAAQAQTLYSTANDFAQFAGGAAVTSSTYYSVAGTVNGIGNTSNPGGTGTIGSLQLTSTGGWNQYLSGSDFGVDETVLSAIDPGSVAPYSAAASGGPGTLTAYSGILTFDVYSGKLTDWNQFGVTFNYPGHYDTVFPSTTSSFTGADGNSWTHCVVDYSLAAENASVSYFGIGIAQNAAGDTAGETLYIDNIQTSAVPEPSPTTALAAVGAAFLAFVAPRRKR
jgi:hypothetical protein